MANFDDSDELKEQSGRIVTAGEPDSDTWRIIGAIIVLSLFVVALLWLVSGLSS